jgi:hypothetical protein
MRLSIVVLLWICCCRIVVANEPATTSVSPQLMQSLTAQSQFTVAVLPMENISLESDVAYHFRQRVIQLLTAKGYTVLASDWIDTALYELGLSHAGQLRLLSMAQLSAAVKADGYVFGIIEEARTQAAGVYNAYVYKSSLKMDSPSSESLWYSLEQRVSKRRFAVDPINAILDIALVNKGADNITAIGALADRLMHSLPNGPTQIVIGEDLLSMATEVNAVESVDINSVDEKANPDKLVLQDLRAQLDTLVNKVELLEARLSRLEQHSTNIQMD